MASLYMVLDISDVMGSKVCCLYSESSRKKLDYHWTILVWMADTFTVFFSIYMDAIFW
jgi:hypothetical protein